MFIRVTLIMHLKFIFLEMMRKLRFLTHSITSFKKIDTLSIYPANMFATSPDVLKNAMDEVKKILINKFFI